MKGFAKAVHGCRSKRDGPGALRMPLYGTIAFEHEDGRSLQLAFEGKKPAQAYTRISNPTVEDFEQRLRLLSGRGGGGGNGVRDGGEQQYHSCLGRSRNEYRHDEEALRQYAVLEVLLADLERGLATL